MLGQICVHFIFITISIPLISGDCIKDAKICLNSFSSDLEDHKRLQFDNTDLEYQHICNPTNGLYKKFVDCVTAIGNQCSTDSKFKHVVCEERHFKMRIIRFMWKATFFHQLCNPGHQLSQGFIENENCISRAFNTRNWKCDVNYDKPIKAMKDWKNSLNTTCSLWQKFRDCSKRDVRSQCGEEASLISDHLFHTHQSYFEKYYSCNLEGISSSNECWYDSILSKTTNTQTTTHPTNEVTDYESNKSSLPMTINDNTSQTQSSDVDLSGQTPKDSTDSQQRNVEHLPNSDQEWERRGWNVTDSESDLQAVDSRQKSGPLVESDDSQSNDVRETNGKSTEQLTSGATPESVFDRYLIIIPIILIFIIKLLMI